MLPDDQATYAPIGPGHGPPGRGPYEQAWSAKDSTYAEAPVIGPGSGAKPVAGVDGPVYSFADPSSGPVYSFADPSSGPIYSFADSNSGKKETSPYSDVGPDGSYAPVGPGNSQPFMSPNISYASVGPGSSYAPVGPAAAYELKGASSGPTDESSF